MHRWRRGPKWSRLDRQAADRPRGTPPSTRRSLTYPLPEFFSAYEAKPIRDIDIRCLELLIDQCRESPLKRQRLKDKLRKNYRAGRLSRQNEDAQQKWRMCEARFALGDFSDFEGWELRDKWAATLWFGQPFPQLMWRGEPDRRVYVIGEQGLGDEVFFGCYLHPGMIAECDARLIPAFSRNRIECVPAMFNEHRTSRIKQALPPDADCWIGAGDLMRYCKPNCRYLSADPAQVERFRAYRGRVGVSWRGRLGEYPLQAFTRGIERPVSLQYDLEWDEEIEQPDLDLRNDVEGLLGLLANLSRVVTVSTSVAHLAICSGVPTDVVLAPTKAGEMKLPWKYHLYGVKPFASLDAYSRARR